MTVEPSGEPSVHGRASTRPAPAAEPVRVLVAEDDDGTRHALVSMIRELGYQCTGAHDGQQAWELQCRAPFEVILSDWKMPRMDGLELCRRTRVVDEGRPYTYFIFMTNFADKAHFLRGMEVGADDYHTKPIDFDELRARLTSASRVIAVYRKLASQNESLRRDSKTSFEMARLDALTGIPNRLAMDEELEKVWARAKRYRRGASIAICDIDRFKAYNDHFGHVAGDDVLRRIAHAIRHELRDSDGLFRYGGEEFLAILPEQSLARARQAIERVRNGVERLAISSCVDRPVVTVSAGVAELDPTIDEAPEDWLRRADAALYRAKASGRNRVMVDPDETMDKEKVDMAAELLRPDAYGALRSNHLTRVDTHISWVFLLDQDVFKVKKPVNFGFLDFRSVAQRKAACEAEVSLNGRLAPGVYRGVVAVRRAGDGRIFVDCGRGHESNDATQGAIVDWAVHMRRLDDARRADHLLANGDLSDAAVHAVAKRIAEFHLSAQCDDETSAFGTLEVVKSNVEENFAQTASFLNEYLTPMEVEEIRRHQRGFVRRHESLFEARIQAKKIRDGHGDLRLEHVYWDEGTPVVIDCIEFNQRFRFGDTCADIAFLAMDFANAGRVDLAERLLARYAREANDFDLYALVDFYESYRAFVRGKVSAFIAADETADGEARLHARAQARRYFLLALAAQGRAVGPRALLAVGGLIASGKSTLAEQLGVQMAAPVVDTDRTRKWMMGVTPTRPVHEAPWQGAYDSATTERVYAEVLRRAEVVLQSGRSVIVDASFRSAATRNAVRDLAKKHGVPFLFVECRVDPEVARARLVRRKLAESVSDGRVDIFDAFRESFEVTTDVLPAEHVVLDTSGPSEAAIEGLRSRIPVWPQHSGPGPGDEPPRPASRRTSR
jgi:diguanylate cyclase (GGDEF)-like protein